MTKVYSTKPYYDDFDPAKKFYRILFRPGRAVQARELTQLQTILQNQIEKFGGNIFKNGSKISGGQSFLLSGNYVKVQETFDLTPFVGKTVTGQTSGAKALVKKTSNSYTTNGTLYPSALYFVYTTGTKFLSNESITIDDTIIAVTSENSNTFSGSCSFASVDSGIYFIKGHFVYAEAQTVLVGDSFSNLPPSAVIGFKPSEGIITSEEDPSLLDPAIGTNNYFAPGADRYYIDLALTSYAYDPTVENSLPDATADEDFINIMTVEYGVIISQNQDTTYNKVEDFVAKRTSDQAGDYTVVPFVAKVKNHLYGNVDKLSIEISPGKAYVKGYAFETIAPSNLDLEKPTEFDSISGFPISLSYGRYLPVQNVTGYANFIESQHVQLFSVRANSVSASAGVSGYYTNKHVGNARIRFLSPSS
jgi:Domain of unknown function (DUF4815)